MRRWGLVCLLAVGMMSGAICAQDQNAAVFEMEFSNSALIPSHWTLRFHPDGTGHFRSERGNAVRSENDPVEPQDIDRDVRLSAPFVEHVFQIAEKKHLFAGGCESHLKVAFQGLKKLSYTGPAGTGSCEFNYSKDSEIQNLGDVLVAVGNTVVEGARLQALLQHDRLGLDKEMEMLVEAANDGRARQFCAIEEILQKLADDPGVLERVKKRARLLLSKANN